jgi:hypothetical protein
MIAVYLSEKAVNPLVAFYDINGRKGEVLLFFFVLPYDTNKVNVNIIKTFQTNYSYKIKCAFINCNIVTALWNSFACLLAKWKSFDKIY